MHEIEYKGYIIREKNPTGGKYKWDFTTWSVIHVVVSSPKFLGFIIPYSYRFKRSDSEHFIKAMESAKAWIDNNPFSPLTFKKLHNDPLRKEWVGKKWVVMHQHSSWGKDWYIWRRYVSKESADESVRQLREAYPMLRFKVANFEIAKLKKAKARIKQC